MVSVGVFASFFILLSVSSPSSLLIVTSPSAPRVFLPASQMKVASTFTAMCVWVLQTVFSCRKRYVQDSVGLDCRYARQMEADTHTIM